MVIRVQFVADFQIAFNDFFHNIGILESSSVENKYSAMVLGKTMTEVTMDAAAEIRATARFMSDILPNQTNVRINAGKNKDKKEKISIVTQ